MSRVPEGLVLAHWSKYFDFFQASSQEVYQAVRAGITQRLVPDTKTEQVIYKEGGVVSAGREYLRVTRKDHAIDICAAPFGTGYFFSWWLCEPDPSGGLSMLLAGIFLAGIASWFFTYLFGVFFGALATLVAIAFALWALGTAVHDGRLGVEREVMAIPVIGRLYEWLFKPVTYYRIDTAHMFQQAVHSALLEVIDGLTSAKGIRALSEAERKPILKQYGEMPTDAGPGVAAGSLSGTPAHTS